jgi:hypothetical protein
VKPDLETEDAFVEEIIKWLSLPPGKHAENVGEPAAKKQRTATEVPFGQLVQHTRGEALQAEVPFEQLVQHARGEALQAESAFPHLRVRRNSEELLEAIRFEVKQELMGDLREEVKQELMDDLREEVKDQLMDDLREEVKQELMDDLLDEVKQELTDDLRDEMKQELMYDLHAEVKDELVDILTDEAIHKIHAEVEALKQATKEVDRRCTCHPIVAPWNQSPKVSNATEMHVASRMQFIFCYILLYFVIL